MADSGGIRKRNHAFSWRHVERDTYVAAWKPLAASDALSAFAGISLFADMHQFVLAVEAALRLILFGLFYPITALFSPREKPKPKAAARAATPGRWGRLAARIYSLEFWLGMGVGFATRATARLAIETAFVSANGKSAMLASLVACAGAGLTAAIVAHLARMLYRNARLPRGQEKERYFSPALLESAVAGLLGGALGGFATGIAGAVIRAGSLAVGAAAGAAAGVLHAGLKAHRALREGRSADAWGKWAFQEMALGATGGVLGVVAIDLLGAQGSVAAPLAPSDAPPSVLTLPVTDPCGIGPCATPLSLAATPFALQSIGPIHEVNVAGQAAPSLQLPPVAQSETVWHASVCHHTAKAAHIRHVAHKPAPPPLPETIIIIQAPPVLLPPPPPLAVVPIVGPHIEQPIHYDPCPPMPVETPYNGSQLDLKGPCADSSISCSETVSFDENGDAARVVLEPRAPRQSGAYFEATRPIVTASGDDPDGSRVALVMPFDRHMLANAQPA